MPPLQTHEQLVRSLPLRLQKFFAIYPPRPGRMPFEQANTAEIPSTEPSAPVLNPFQPHKHPVTGRWHPPIYSLRRQADLAKLAAAHGVEELLPDTKKNTGERAKQRIEHGLRVRGTGVGQKVRGHKEERTLQQKLDSRRAAMRRMPGMILDWKKKGHGRGWREWPR